MGFEEWIMVARGTAGRNRPPSSRRRRRMLSFVAVFHLLVGSLIPVFGIYSPEIVEPRNSRRRQVTRAA